MSYHPILPYHNRFISFHLPSASPFWQLLAIEESFDDFCGKKTRVQATVAGPMGVVTSRKDPIRDSPDFVQCMAEIMAAAN